MLLLLDDIDSFLDLRLEVVLLEQGQLDLPVQVEQDGDLPCGVHRIHTVFDVGETLLEWLKARLAFLLQEAETFLKSLQILFSLVSVDELLVQLVDEEFCLQKAIVVVKDDLHARLVPPFVLCLSLQLGKALFDLSYASVRVHCFQVGCGVKVLSLDLNLLAAHSVLRQYLW